MELQVLRARARCSVCASKLPPRTEAWVEGAEVVCPTCYRMTVATAPAVPAVPSAAPPSVPAAAPMADGVPEAPVPDGAARGPQPPQRRDRPAATTAGGLPARRPAPARAETQAPEPAPAAAEALPSEPAPDPAETQAPEPAPVAAEVLPSEPAPAAAEALLSEPAPAEPVIDLAALEAGRPERSPAEELPDGQPVAGQASPDTSEVAPLAEQPAGADDPAGALDAPNPISWKGEFFQGPPVKEAVRRTVVEKPSVSLKFTATAAAIARGRAAPSDEVGSALAAAENRGLVWLAERRTPSGQCIDHVAVTTNGIWLVMVEPRPTGRVEKRDVGDWFTSEPRLFVGDADRTAAARRLDALDRGVEGAVARSRVADVPRYKVLCFVDSPPGWLERPFPFDDVWVTWSHHLVEPMLASVQYQQDEVAEFAEALDRLLPPPGAAAG